MDRIGKNDIVGGINRNDYAPFHIGIISAAGIHGSIHVSNEEASGGNARLLASIEKTGMKRRFHNAPEENLWTHFATALTVACMKVGMTPMFVNGVWVSGVNGVDYTMPQPGPIVANILGIPALMNGGVPGTGCAGFLHALQAAANQLVLDSLAGEIRLYAVLAGDQLWSIFEEDGPSINTGIFGEGASCVLLTNDANWLAKHQHVQLMTSSCVTTPAGAYNAHRRIGKTLHHKASWIAKFVSDLHDRLYRTLDVERLPHGTLLIPHQANCNVLARWEQELEGVTVHRHTVETYGNLSAASIPIALDHEWDEGNLTDDRNVVMMAFGEGMSLAVCELRPRMKGKVYGPDRIPVGSEKIRICHEDMKKAYWTSEWGQTDPRRPATV